ncbi:hypothetical protein PG994_010622 [Apiospora phragmitis]|uniref:Uncharacterized protein n=1 Tax=Apiospora phragmitis TaxID=2905665 RepID=A0ABR1TQX3_9PEZI
MQAENRPPPRRAASHGTLRSSYANHARPLHKPLRSVNENMALLPSPGALESMLKTTTETGDIGIFSIKPVKTSASITASSTRHGLHGPKSQYQLPMRRSVDDFRRQDDRHRLPSYRDTTSEILSMYGSNSQSSSNSVLSHSIDDPSQRSYSMTTVGSRHLSHNRSNNTLQSNYSGGTLQRPRSPFPYPTRLKRPGARPASPAITGPGVVDYSRMVEIDRISLRTGYGLGAPALSRPPGRLPPLGVRLDMNLSSPTLPTQRSHYAPNIRSGANSNRTVSAASGTSCSLSGCEKVHSSSTRTSSLTSVINMYHRMPPTLRHVQFGTLDPPPRYYDYTEDFEFKQPFVMATIEPVAPTPTRIPSIHKSLVLREGSGEQLSVHSGSDCSPDTLHADPHHANIEETGDLLDETQSRQSRATQDSSERDITSAANSISRATKSSINTEQGTDIDFLPSQTGRDSADMFNQSPDLNPRQAAVYSHQGFRAAAASRMNTASLERQVVFHGSKTPTIRSEQGVIVRDDNHDFKSNEREQKDAGEIAFQRRSTSEPGMKYSACCSRHGSSEHDWVSLPTNSCASMSEAYRKQGHLELLSSPDGSGDYRSSELDRTIGRSMESAPMMTAETTPEVTGGEVKESDGQHEINSVQDSDSKSVSERASIGGRGESKRYKRNMGLEVVTHNLQKAGDNDFPQLTPECSNTSLISPKPISPARQLKVKNSIPQLMKALPPLPNPSLVSATPSSIVDVDECAEILQPFSLSRSGTPRAQNQHGLQQPRDIFNLRYPIEATHTQKKLPRIRFKTKIPVTQEPNQRDSRPWNSENNYSWCRRTPDSELLETCDGAGSHKSGRSSLRAPQFLSTHRTSSSPLTETVRRYPDVQHSGVIQSLTRQQPRDLFTASSRLCNAFRSDSRSISRADNGAAKETAPESDPAFVLAHGSGSRRLSKAQSQTSGSGQLRETAPPQEMRKKRTPGLTKRLSNLTRLLARNRRTQSERQDTPLDENSTSDAKQPTATEANLGLEDVDFDSKSFTVSEGIPGELPRRLKFRRRVRDRISKWIKETRRRMNVQGRGRRQDGDAE